MAFGMKEKTRKIPSDHRCCTAQYTCFATSFQSGGRLNKIQINQNKTNGSFTKEQTNINIIQPVNIINNAIKAALHLKYLGIIMDKLHISFESLI